MKSIGKLIEKLNELPRELNKNKDVIIIDQCAQNEIFTTGRLKIIEFLRESNPVTVKDIKDFFGKKAHNDLLVLFQLNYVFIDGPENEDGSVVRLNRNIQVIPFI